MYDRTSPADAVVTRSFGCAVFLRALGHRVEDVRSRDGSVFNAYGHFSASARKDVERYYAARDALNAIGARFVIARPTTKSEEVTDVADERT